MIDKLFKKLPYVKISREAVENDVEMILGVFLSLSAGSLVYVGASHLLPQSEAEHKRFSLIALATGILVAFVIVFSKK